MILSKYESISCHSICISLRLKAKVLLMAYVASNAVVTLTSWLITLPLIHLAPAIDFLVISGIYLLQDLCPYAGHGGTRL